VAGDELEGELADVARLDFADTARETLVWATFPADTEYFGRLDQQAMVNYRVPDLEAMLAQLRDAGIDIEGPMEHENGRFGWGVDPEGNRFELWQPVAGQ